MCQAAYSTKYHDVKVNFNNAQMVCFTEILLKIASLHLLNREYYW